MRQKMIIDTDPGQDDVMALLMAIGDTNVDIVAVTTVCGNSTIENTTRNARYVIGLVGRADIPVYSGAKSPLVRSLQTAKVHGENGLEGINPTISPRLTNDAVKRMIDLVRMNPRDITIVALGPLTNVARAIQCEPQTMKLVKNIIVMGGAINVPGNQSSVAEFNMFVDPEAADIVLNFAVEITLVPLDICGNITMSEDDFMTIPDDKLRTMLLTMNDNYGKRLEQELGVRKSVMYDPVAMYCALYAKKCSRAPRLLRIETKSVERRGMTMVCRSASATRQVTPFVVTSLSQADFRRTYLQNVSRLSAREDTTGLDTVRKGQRRSIF